MADDTNTDVLASSNDDGAFLKWVLLDNVVVFEGQNYLHFKDKGPYFLIGPNQNGKSSLFELIRRCLSSSKNHSLSSMFNTSKASSVVCVYELNRRKQIITAMIGVPRDDQQKPPHVKVVCEIVNDKTVEKCCVDVVFEVNEVNKPLCVKKLESYHGEILKTMIEKTLPLRQNTLEEISKKLSKYFGKKELKAHFPKTKEDLETHFATEKEDLETHFAKEKEELETHFSKKKLELETQFAKKKKELETQFAKKKEELETHFAKEKEELETQFAKKKEELETHFAKVKEEFETHFAKMKEELETNCKSTDQSVCDAILAPLEMRIVHILSSRGVGMVQWTESKRLSQNFKDENYQAASKTAEIITWYEENKEKLPEKDDVEKYFRIITDGSNVKFHLDNKGTKAQTLFVSNDGGRFPVLKLSEGILEAKTCAIVLGVDRFTTILYEDPEKGMHPQMISRLRDLVLRKIKNKTILITTHHPAFTAFWNIDKVFLFRPSKFSSERGRKSAFVKRIPAGLIQIGGDKDTCENTRVFLSSWEYSAIFFAGRVLIVEGPSDHIVITELIDVLVEDQDQELLMKLANPQDNGKFLNFLEGIEVIAARSKNNIPAFIQICRDLAIDYVTVEDNDEANGSVTDESADTANPPKAFRWDNGDIEDVIIKFANHCRSKGIKPDTSEKAAKICNITITEYGLRKTETTKLKPTASRKSVRSFIESALKLSADYPDLEENIDGSQFIRLVKFLHDNYKGPT